MADFQDKELADMVRNSIYAKSARFGDGTDDKRFLIVLAIPYGEGEGGDHVADAIEAFANFLRADDWKERDFQVYDHRACQQFFAASMEDVEGNRD